MDRLEGGYLGARPAWSSSVSPGVWTLAQALARRSAGTWPSASYLYDPYFESVSLLLHMNGSNASTTFVDSSLSGLAVTANGNAQISTAQSKFGGSSGAFDGTGDYLTIAASSAGGFDFGTGSFTIEAWVRLSFMPTSGYPGSFWIVGFGPANVNPGFDFYLTSTNIVCSIADFTSPTASGLHGMTINTWYHVAAVRSGTTVSVYVDGILKGSGTTTASAPTVANGVAICAAEAAGATGGNLNGFVDELRVTRGVARYTANFVVPFAGTDEGAAPYDPYFDYVSLLLRCNGENNSTTFTDSSNNALAISRGGSAVISTTESRFGSASVFFNGVNDSLFFADPALGTGNLTIELWFKTASSVQYAQLIGNEGTGYTLLINNASSTSGDLALYVAGGGVCATTGVNCRDNLWHHVAVTRSGTAVTIWVDGISRATGTNGGTFSSALSTYVGRNNVYTPRNVIGYIDDVRLTKGVCRYTTSFRPVGPFSTSGKLVDPYLTSTSLLLPMTGDNGNTSFFDRSNNFLRATEFGNAKVSTTTSKFGGTSAYFDGTGDYLTLPVAPLSGTEAFTIEAWVYIGATLSSYCTIFGSRITNTGFSCGIDTSRNLYVYSNTSGVLAASTALPVNQWTHVAFSYTGSQIYIFLNGGQIYSAAATLTQNTAAVVGNNNSNGGTEYFNGYMDDLRITKGIARYLTSFVPPERAFNDEAFNDPHYNNVSLLLHMDGTNNSTTFTDSSPLGLPVTANADAKISTAQNRFGGSSGAFDGTGDYLSQATRTDLALGTSDFTIETWVYLNSYTQFSFWESSPIGSGGGRSTGFIWYMTTNGTMYLFHNTANLITTSSAIFPLSTWTHVACCRSSGVTRLFVNGISVGSTSTTITDTAGGRVIGAFCDGGSYSPNGYLDEFRITKGVARYTANFLPPTLPFYNTTAPTVPTADPSFSSVSLLLHMNGSNGSTTFTDSSPTPLGITANGSAQISNTQTLFGGNSASFLTTDSYLSFSNATGPISFGASDFTVEAWIYPLNPTVNTFGIERSIIGMWSATNPAAQGWLMYLDGGSFKFLGEIVVGDNPVFSAANAITTEKWYHVAAVRYNGFITGYVDGFAVASGNVGTSAFAIGSNSVGVGGYARGTAAAGAFNGYIKEARITKNVARYTSNFYIPRAAFPDA